MGFCLEHVIKIQNFFSKRSIAVPIKSCHYASKHEHNKIFTKQCIVDIEFFEIGLEWHRIHDFSICTTIGKFDFCQNCYFLKLLPVQWKFPRILFSSIPLCDRLILGVLVNLSTSCISYAVNNVFLAKHDSYKANLLYFDIVCHSLAMWWIRCICTASSTSMNEVIKWLLLAMAAQSAHVITVWSNQNNFSF